MYLVAKSISVVHPAVCSSLTANAVPKYPHQYIVQGVVDGNEAFSLGNPST